MQIANQHTVDCTNQLICIFFFFTLIKNVVHIIKREKKKSSSEMRCQLIIKLCIIKTEKCWEKQHLQLPVQILRGV